MNYLAGKYDVAVVGAGHAGIEAALAAARLGCKTAIFTINMDAVGNCPCNPSIGGTAKGHLVREIDALGGEMGKTADECFLQSRMLNRGKGPAVHSLRAQIDRRKYSTVMKHKLELQNNLDLRQAEITDIEKVDGGYNLTTRMLAVFKCKTVIIATGTYLGGRIFVGEVSYESGPDGIFPAAFLGASLKKLGLPLRRFKTGTPARVLRSSIDFSELEVQKGDEPPQPFSYETENLGENKVECHISWTNDETKQIILENIHRSPLYAGKIEGVGPRYCPSFEDKIMRFKDKPRHQLFIEPCGLDTEEMYLQGMSSSLPEEVQLKFYHTIKGLEHCLVMRPAYAIEYDCVDPLAMNPTLEFKDFSGLFGAGQFNGSSGYEEAAAQGLVAGINAAMKVLGREPVIFDRSESYIGTLVDDLVTKGANEPYRMMTSRSEYRLVLRQDNADLRLTEKSYRIGLASERRYVLMQKKYSAVASLSQMCDSVNMRADIINEYLAEHNSAVLSESKRISDLASRPEISLAGLLNFVPRGTFDKFSVGLPEEGSAAEKYARKEIIDSVEIGIKYKGYIEREKSIAEKISRLEDLKIPQDFDFSKVSGLTIECRQKLSLYKPTTIAQASRISGVSPSDISVLLVYFGR